MTQKPNLLLVMVDQMTPHLSGAYGHPVVRTPNLDRLVREGVRFDAAYSPCPVCGPARAALLSGQYVSNCGVYDNAAAWPEDIVTIPHYLTLAGYDTVLSGKMHFVGADQLHGFRERLVTNIYPSDFRWTPARQDPFAMPEGKEPQFRPTGGQAGQYVGDAIRVGRWSSELSFDEETHFRALEYLHAWSSEERHQPFFLCVSYHHPHEPFWPPPKYWDMYEGQPIETPTCPDDLESTRSMQDRWLDDYHGCGDWDLTDPESAARVRRAYYALVTYVDDKVGELMASLEENGLAGDTVIIFCSDHGDMLCERGMVQKRCFYEWSARVPLIVRFPDRRKAGVKIDAPVSLIDLLPTTLDLAGVRERLPHDGRSLMPLIKGHGADERAVLSEIHAEGIHAPCFMVRRGRFKYVYVHGHDEQFFDLEADPGEWNDLAGDPAYGEVKEALKAQILEQFDPDAIDAAVEASIRRRRLAREAMEATGTRWDVTPQFDGRKLMLDQYLP